MRFIPRSVMVGFVNALAILSFTAQLPHLIDVPALVYPMVTAGLLIMVFPPKLTTAVPAPLVAIVLLTAATVIFALNVPSVGDEGEWSRSTPREYLWALIERIATAVARPQRSFGAGPLTTFR